MDATSQYPNPYELPGQPLGQQTGQAGQQPYAPVTGGAGAPGMDSVGGPVPPTPQAYGPAQTTLTTPPKKGKGLAIVLLIVGILIGGLAGFFIAYFFVFQPERDRAALERTQFQSQISQLQTQTAALQAQLDATGGPTGAIPVITGPGSGTSGTGTGTAPTTGGITADAQTANWVMFNDPQYHFSFKYPADYEVKMVPETDTTILVHYGVFKIGESVEAGSVRVYKSPADKGPSHRNLLLNNWPKTLPVPTTQTSAGAGSVQKVEESPVNVNGTEGAELSAAEAVKIGSYDAKPGGQTLTGYLFEEQFNASYLVGNCSSDTSSQRNLVGCLFGTTFTFVR